MNAFSKENYDVSGIFLGYLAFLGNTTKVGIALKIPTEVVEVLATKEDWAAKLRTYMGLRHEQELPETDKLIRRSVNLIQACQMRDLIRRVLDHIHRSVGDVNLIDMFSPRNPKTNKPRFNAKILGDLVRAFYVATRVIALSVKISDKTEEPSEEATERQRQTLYAAIDRAMGSMDRMPGIDSVALAKEGLAKWESKEGTHDS